MERIVLEVNDHVAKNWRHSSEKKRREVLNTINRILDAAFRQKDEDDFIEFVKEIQNKAEQRGLTEDILNSILNEPD